ncbi:putative sugar O-methyltransferase [Nitrosospira multiformis]|nr:putative sugar O-methyltransferase [Nitrosospira multiformis]
MQIGFYAAGFFLNAREKISCFVCLHDKGLEAFPINNLEFLKMPAGLKSVVNNFLIKSGYSVKRIREHELKYFLSSYDKSRELPLGAQSFLNSENPRLQSLRAAYRGLQLPVLQHTVWREQQLDRQLSLAWFRGDNLYVWQYRQLKSDARLRFYLAVLDVENRDKLDLLERLKEDGLFGCWTFSFTGRTDLLSRDLLDSVNEINYLDEHLHLSERSEFKVLDIGAGYGRFAHRMCEAFPNLSAYDCIDAVPESTFLCDYYLQFRGIGDRARSVPLTEYQTLSQRYDLAVNIHSFSECSYVAVRWWLEQIRSREIEWLLIVPNDPTELLTSEADGTKKEFMSDVLNCGYELWDRRPTYMNPDLREFIGVNDHFFLFRRKVAT